MDKALKQRLVGASVIIALVVIVLPMLLSGRPENPAHQTQEIELPPRPEALTFETRRFPVDQPQSAPAEEDRPVVKPATQPPAVEPDSAPVVEPQPTVKNPEENIPAPGQDLSQPSVDEPEVVESPSAEPATESAPLNPTTGEEAAARKATSVVAGRYLVQVASLASAENATRLMTSLQEKGYPVLLDTVESSVGTLNRVRVGPYLTEAEAALVVTEVAKTFSGVNPKVVDLQPEASATQSESPDSLARWVVQAGSFSEAVNADRLVEQLRADGMNAYQEKVSSGSTVNFRVRIGPFLERETALKAQQALSKSRSIDGVVVSAD